MEAKKNPTSWRIYRLAKRSNIFMNCLFFIILFSFFFQNPEWCINRKEEMSPDCKVDKNGVKYYVSDIASIPEPFKELQNYISWGCMSVLFLIQMILSFCVGLKNRAPRTIALGVLLFCDIFFDLLFGSIMNQIIDYNINGFFRIFFIIIYSDRLRESMKNALTTLKEAYAGILVYFLNLGIWSCLAFILFFGKKSSAYLSRLPRLLRS